MKISLINGSPKVKGSSSGVLLSELKVYFDGNDVTECGLHASNMVTQPQLQAFVQQEALRTRTQ
jgi:hypothetical protein